MTWSEIVAVVVTVVLGATAIGAMRVRSTDPKAAHLWFGLSREENGRLGAIVGVVGLVVVGVIDAGFFTRHPLAAAGWGLLIVACAYRGWIRKGSRRRAGDAGRR